MADTMPPNLAGASAPAASPRSYPGPVGTLLSESRAAPLPVGNSRAGQVGSNLARIARRLGPVPPTCSLANRKQVPLPTVARDEMALLRAYRDCSPEDRALLVRHRCPPGRLDNNSLK